ncbi:UNVERIFIED_CONTAM: Retrovirus-related Pol polyprotein from transposon TNT 1-94 [Sesamum latifolium]|uniref:Retrovirus-related Pol polyprotein from transposon TNT 1-94 n=1 Tax=Sesamum latifolium TaxID=2727402 RepID=A0AAW2XPL3_9LAMI
MVLSISSSYHLDRLHVVEDDHCEYVKSSENNLLILSLYVDDILLPGTNIEMIVPTQKLLSSTFEMKDKGEAEYILGSKIKRDRSRKLLSLSQETYIKRIIEKFYMHIANPVNRPMDKSCIPNRELCPKIEEKKKLMAKMLEL